MHFAILGNSYQSRHIDAISRFFTSLTKAMPEATYSFDRPFGQWLISQGAALPAGSSFFEGNDFEADLCLSFGGDGTLLHTAGRIVPRQLPVIGINTGHLGYLTASSIADPDAAARLIATNGYDIESRAMLQASFLRPDGSPATVTALNEVAVTRLDTASMIIVEAQVDSTLLATFPADGLLVATPTGSTGYNLSVGGPLVTPQAPVVIFTPIAPHSLTMRPLVLPAGVTVDLRVSSRSGNFLLAYDGLSEQLPASTAIKVAPAPFVTRIATARGTSFFSTLRTKLALGT